MGPAARPHDVDRESLRAPLHRHEAARPGVLYEGAALDLGYFSRPVAGAHAPWGRVTADRVHVVFPVTLVFVTSGSSELVGDSTTALLYEARSTSGREMPRLSGEGFNYVGVDRDVAGELTGRRPGAGTAPGPAIGQVAVDGRLYISQWTTLRSLALGRVRPGPRIEEIVLDVLGTLFERWGERNGRGPSGPHQQLVNAARVYVNAHFREPLSLEAVARNVYVSPFHLARTFRRVTGYTLHDYLMQLRLRASLELICGTRATLRDVARAVGFRSHSHFTARFHAAFHIAPSALRLAGSPSP